MIFPRGIIGPRFDEGDLVTFIFEGAELTFRLPKIPINRNNLDEVSTLKDFRSINTENWDTNDQAYPCFQLSLQRWNYENEQNLDDVARAELYVGLVDAKELHREQNTFLCKEHFEATMLSWHDYSYGERHNEKYQQDVNWPALPNRFNGRSIKQKHLDWFLVELVFSLQERPIGLAMIPINSRFVLMAFIEIQSLHYADRANPYSNDLLKQFERDLFEDFLSHIKLEYSPELIATINSLKNQAQA